MPAITVNPTRMELTRLKGKLRTAQRGHKLLKDKRDELMKRFLDTVREVRALRAQVEEELMRVHGSFTVASALMSGAAMEQALMYPKQSVELTMTLQNIMSVNVPEYHYRTRTGDSGERVPKGLSLPARRKPSSRPVPAWGTACRGRGGRTAWSASSPRPHRFSPGQSRSSQSDTLRWR